MPLEIGANAPDKRFFWLETSYNRTPSLKHGTRPDDVTNGLLPAYHLLGS